MTPGDIRVLVADDDDLVRGALTLLIEREAGLVLVGAAVDADEAVELAERERPDVAILDVSMPGGGVAAARGIRRRVPETRILALSARDDRATVLDMLEAGAAGYLVKGSSVEAIIDSIRKAAAGQGSLSVEITGGVIEELAGQLSQRRREQERLRLRQARIRRVLEDEHALEIVYQPICDLRDRTMVGAEALARFPGRPRRGPDRWFHEADEVGLRRELELAAARSALTGMAHLPDGVFLSVNVSPEALIMASFRKLLQGVDASRVVIEVTEHARVDDYDALNDALSGLRSLGARLAIDDAGAGFASLRHILRLEPDFIKLDRGLINGIEHDRSLQALAAGLISFAAKIDATIVAEGIESAAEIEALADLGVSHGQGYFLARPGPLPLSLSPAT